MIPVTTVFEINNDTASAREAGNRLELAISRALIGQKGKTPAFDFHWADNIQSFEGAWELGVNGDSAPDRRWNYRYEVGAENGGGIGRFR
jgi:hypothetical protein